MNGGGNALAEGGAALSAQNGRPGRFRMRDGILLDFRAGME